MDQIGKVSASNQDYEYYIGYGLVSLMLINVICVMIYCYKKADTHTIKYEVVSMQASDTEMDI